MKIKCCWKDVLRSDKTSISLIINKHNHKLTKFLNLIFPNFYISCIRSHNASCLGQYAPSSARTWMFFFPQLLAKTFEISCVLIFLKKKTFKMVTTLSRPIQSAIILVIKEDDYIRREMDKTITLVMTNRIGPHSVLLPFTRNTCIAEPRETRGDAHKMSGMGGGEKWSKLCNWGGLV